MSIPQSVDQTPEMFRSLVELSPHLVSLHTLDGAFQYVSPGYQQLLGYTPDALVGRPIQELIHPQEASRFRAAWTQAHASRQTRGITSRLRAHDGRFVPVEFIFKGEPGSKNVLVFAHDGTTVSYLDDALRILARGTDILHGVEFFRLLVSQVGAAMRMPFVFITEHVENKTKVRMLAFWKGNDFGEPFEYGLPGTPCDAVINEARSCYYPVGIQALFPKDQDLVSLSAQGYVGVPIFDSNEEVIGHLAVLDSKPMVIEDRELSILRIFASRAAIELERWQAQDRRSSAAS